MLELKGNGFILREWEINDAPWLQKNANNYKISDFLLDQFPSPYTLEDANNWIALNLNHEPVLNFAIVIGGKVSGVIGIVPRTDVYRLSPLLGYWLAEDYWGKGIMTEAIKIFTNYCFKELDYIRIQANVLGNNPASMRVLEKAGFKLEGVLRNAMVKNDVILNEHIYGLCKA